MCLTQLLHCKACVTTESRIYRCIPKHTRLEESPCTPDKVINVDLGNFICSVCFIVDNGNDRSICCKRLLGLANSVVVLTTMSMTLEENKGYLYYSNY